MSLITHKLDNNFDSESFQFSYGPTSKTTIGQFAAKMNVEEQISQLLSHSAQEKNEEIKNLKEQNEKLRQENEKLKQQIKHPDQSISNNNEIKAKVMELRKNVDDLSGLLGAEHNRPMLPRNSFHHIIPNTDAKPSTSTNENSKPFEMPNHVNHTFNSHESNDYPRPSDAELINAATEPRHNTIFHPNGHSGHAHNLPTAVSHQHMQFNHQQRRFNNTPGGMNGMNNNNNNRNRNNHNNNNNNNNININNNNNKQNQHTIFVSWPGTMTLEQLRELFDQNDVAEIRYTNQKQFAHVDLKSDSAVQKAIALHGTVKDEKQGALRVEQGKPRNPTENGQQRSQNQNKNYTNRNNNNKTNNYNNNNNNPQQKKFNHNNHNNHNHNHNSQYPPANYSAPDEKDNGWGPPGPLSFTPQEHPKQNGDSV